jgi:hypothetical protein
MEANTTKRVVLVALHMILRPWHAVRWLGSFVARKTALELGLPWMSWRAIEYLRDELRPGLRVFEWGAGGSTVFFAERGCRVVTVESDFGWSNAVASALKTRNCFSNVIIRRMSVSEDKPASIREYLEAVHTGEPWDVVVVDGPESSNLSRVDCVREATDALQPSGFLVLDDAYRSAYACVPQLLRGWTRRGFQGLGPARLGVTQTDVYLSPSQDARR